MRFLVTSLREDSKEPLAKEVGGGFGHIHKGRLVLALQQCSIYSKTMLFPDASDRSWAQALQLQNVVLARSSSNRDFFSKDSTSSWGSTLSVTEDFLVSNK